MKCAAATCLLGSVELRLQPVDGSVPSSLMVRLPQRAAALVEEQDRLEAVELADEERNRQMMRGRAAKAIWCCANIKAQCVLVRN